MDRLFGMNMQREMLGDPSGLTDSMWDLVVDSVGGLVRFDLPCRISPSGAEHAQ